MLGPTGSGKTEYIPQHHALDPATTLLAARNNASHIGWVADGSPHSHPGPEAFIWNRNAAISPSAGVSRVSRRHPRSDRVPRTADDPTTMTATGVVRARHEPHAASGLQSEAVAGCEQPGVNNAVESARRCAGLLRSRRPSVRHTVLGSPGIFTSTCTRSGAARSATLPAHNLLTSHLSTLDGEWLIAALLRLLSRDRRLISVT